MLHDRPVIPRSLRPAVMSHLHAGHASASSMFERAAICLYWPLLASTGLTSGPTSSTTGPPVSSATLPATRPCLPSSLEIQPIHSSLSARTFSTSTHEIISFWVSTAYNPRANKRAELEVKHAKRLIRGIVSELSWLTETLTVPSLASLQLRFCTNMKV